MASTDPPDLELLAASLIEEPEALLPYEEPPEAEDEG